MHICVYYSNCKDCPADNTLSDNNHISLRLIQFISGIEPATDTSNMHVQQDTEHMTLLYTHLTNWSCAYSVMHSVYCCVLIGGSRHSFNLGDKLDEA